MNEALVWIAFSASLADSLMSAQMFIFLATAILAVLMGSSSPKPTRKDFWRRSGTNMEEHGRVMAATLIPSLLLKLNKYHGGGGRLVEYSIVCAIVAFPVPFCWVVLVPFVLQLDKIFESFDCILLALSWAILKNSIRSYRSMHGVWTEGEWNVIAAMISLGPVSLVSGNIIMSPMRTYQLVALSGLYGTIVGCAMGAKLDSVAVRILVLVGFPVVSVEASLWMEHEKEYQFPRSLTWLSEFLTGVESSTASDIPRYYFVLYWALILLLTLPISFIATTAGTDDGDDEKIPRTIARKWFHFIAILLFTPVTIVAPELMSLSYAIALCALMVLECLRQRLPKSFQTFYLRFLDPRKDQPGQVIVSHMALIVGCALPHWIQEWVTGTPNNNDGNTTTSTSSFLLLSLWGVLVLGVGDSMGAIVGTLFGKTKWGRNRSVEGSLAVFISTGACCSMFRQQQQQPWLFAVTCVTLLEAFTSQIDNIVLPLAGAALLL